MHDGYEAARQRVVELLDEKVEMLKEIESLRKQLAACQKERDELVETLKYFSEYGYGRDICIAALAKVGNGE